MLGHLPEGFIFLRIILGGVGGELVQKPKHESSRDRCPQNAQPNLNSLG